jgi:hypothetical protein
MIMCESWESERRQLNELGDSNSDILNSKAHCAAKVFLKGFNFYSRPFNHLFEHFKNLYKNIWRNILLLTFHNNSLGPKP